MFRNIYNNWKTSFVASFATALSLAVLFGLAASGWPGDDIHENCFEDYLAKSDCFCERLRGSHAGDVWFAQPVNSISNISYTIVGLSIAYVTDTKRFPCESWWKGQGRSVMATNQLFPIAYATFTCLMGTGSTLLHASFLAWTSSVDCLFMINLALFVCIYNVARITSVRNSIPLLLHCIIMTMLIFWTIFSNHQSLQLRRMTFSVLVALAVMLEIIVRIKNEYWLKWWLIQQKDHPKCTSDLRLIMAAIGLFLLGTLIWNISKPGSPLCNPESTFQGHAIWHFLTATSIGFLFAYFLSEQHSCDHAQQQQEEQNGNNKPVQDEDEDEEKPTDSGDNSSTEEESNTDDSSSESRDTIMLQR